MHICVSDTVACAGSRSQGSAVFRACKCLRSLDDNMSCPLCIKCLYACKQP